MYLFPIFGKEEWEQSEFSSNVSECVLLKCKGYVSLDETVFNPVWKKFSESIFNCFMETQKKMQGM